MKKTNQIVSMGILILFTAFSANAMENRVSTLSASAEEIHVGYTVFSRDPILGTNGYIETRINNEGNVTVIYDMPKDYQIPATYRSVELPEQYFALTGKAIPQKVLEQYNRVVAMAQQQAANAYDLSAANDSVEPRAGCTFKNVTNLQRTTCPSLTGDFGKSHTWAVRSCLYVEHISGDGVFARISYKNAWGKTVVSESATITAGNKKMIKDWGGVPRTRYGTVLNASNDSYRYRFQTQTYIAGAFDCDWGF